MTCPPSAVRGVAKGVQLRSCLQDASTPEVPICAAGKVATAVVLARRSAPERVRPAAPTTPAAERGSACCSAGAGGLPHLLLLLRPNQAPRRHVPLDDDVVKVGHLGCVEHSANACQPPRGFSWDPVFATVARRGTTRSGHRADDATLPRYRGS